MVIYIKVNCFIKIRIFLEQEITAFLSNYRYVYSYMVAAWLHKMTEDYRSLMVMDSLWCLSILKFMGIGDILITLSCSEMCSGVWYLLFEVIQVCCLKLLFAKFRLGYTNSCCLSKRFRYPIHYSGDYITFHLSLASVKESVFVFQFM